MKVGAVRRTEDGKKLAQQSIVSRVHTLKLELLFSFLPENITSKRLLKIGLIL